MSKRIVVMSAMNLDYRRLFEAVMVATRPYSVRPARLASFEVPSSSEWGRVLGIGFEPNRFVEISDHLQAKLDALSCFASELKEWPHPRSLEAVRIHAQRWGSEVGCDAAEPFAVLREVEP